MNAEVIEASHASPNGGLDSPELLEEGPPMNRHSTEALKDIAFGSAAGVVGKYIEYPFDTVKVRLQSQPDGLPSRYSGPIDCFRQSLQERGVRGLYRGISAPLVGAALETSSLFFSYRVAQTIVRMTIYPTEGPLPLPALVACGGASGAFTSLLLTPIELVKCKMQVPSSLAMNQQAGPGASALIRSIYRADGLMGFWRGQLGTLIRETGGSAAWFGSYEMLSSAFRSFNVDATSADQPRLHIWQQMIAGSAAGMSYNFIFYPADTIKSRMQTEEIGILAGGKRSFLGVGKVLWKEQGLRGFYRGCGITVARAAPSSAFIFTVYEALRSWFD